MYVYNTHKPHIGSNLILKFKVRLTPTKKKQNKTIENKHKTHPQNIGPIKGNVLPYLFNSYECDFFFLYYCCCWYWPNVPIQLWNGHYMGTV